MVAAIRDTPQSAHAVEGWIKNWTPRVDRSVSVCLPIFDEMSQGGVRRVVAGCAGKSPELRHELLVEGWLSTSAQPI
jgi:hypothetical protein